MPFFGNILPTFRSYSGWNPMSLGRRRSVLSPRGAAPNCLSFAPDRRLRNNWSDCQWGVSPVPIVETSQVARRCVPHCMSGCRPTLTSLQL